MEPLGGVASVIAVIGITRTIAFLLKDYHQGVSDAPLEIQRLYQSISSLRLTLSRIDMEDIKRRHWSTIHFQNLLKKRKGPLQLLNKELEDLRAKLESNRYPRKTSRKRERIVYLMWPFHKTDVEKSMNVIERYKSTLELEFSIENLNTSLDVFDIVEDIKSDAQDFRESQTRQKVIDWLTKGVPDPSSEHVSARSFYEPTTGSWLTTGTTMNHWIKAKNSMMWLKGGAGFGKSLLCSTVIEYMQNLFKRDGRIVVAYWYFTFTDTEKQSVANVLCSLVRDIYSNRQDTPPELKAAFEAANHGQQRPTVARLLDLLKVVMCDFEGIYVIFDAVDECRKADGERGRFLDVLKLIHSWDLDQLHVFFSSRAEVDITDAFGALIGKTSFSVVEVQGDQCQRDIEMFLDLRLESRFEKWTPELKAFVRHEIVSRADGMFRLVALLLEILATCWSEAKVRAKVKSLPETLDCFYERALLEIGLEYRTQALVALQLLSHAERELSLDELAEAMVVDPLYKPHLNHTERFMDSRAVLEILPSGLVTHTMTDVPCGVCGIIRLAHYSVFEYLSSDRVRTGAAAFFQLDASGSQQAIARVSIAYLQAIGEGNPTISSALYDDYHFLHYAASYLLSHLEVLESSSIHESLQNLSTSFFTNGSRAWNIWKHFGARDTWTRSSKTSNLANHKPLDNVALRRQAYRFSGLNPLSVASMLGAESVIHTLLETASNLDHVTDKCKLGTPLYAASTFGKILPLRLLLSNKAAANAQGGPLGKAIHAASSAGHVEVVQTLLAAGADVDSLSSDHRTPLLMTLDCLKDNPQSTSYRNIIFLLLNQGADVNYSPTLSEAEIVHPESHSPLTTAILSKREDIVSALLQHGAVVEIEDWLYGTPLHLATQLNCSAIFRGLIEYGANMYARDARGSLVDIAVSQQSASIVQDLLRLDSSGDKGRSTPAPSLFGNFDDTFRDKVAEDASLGSVKVLQEAGFGSRTRDSETGLCNFEQASNEGGLTHSILVPNRKRRRSPTLIICGSPDD
ncbi:ankyrin [Cadophora sp. DSE1049]|nr:ankyrin [Cadophora sp. DSE1049]